MKYCIYCGEQLVDEAQFCSCCGYSSYSDALNQAAEIPAEESPRSYISVRKYYRDLCTSKMGTFLVVLAWLMLIGNIVMAFFPLRSLGIDENVLSSFIDVKRVESFLFSSMFLSLVQPAFIAIGILITVSDAKRAYTLYNPRGIRLITGFCKVMRILHPLLLILASFAFISACSSITRMYDPFRWAQIGAKYPAESENLITMLRAVLGILILILWGGCIFSVFYYNKLIHTLESIVLSIERNRPAADISMFVVVMCFIGGAGTFSIFWGSSWITALANAANGGIQIIAAFALLSIRRNASIKSSHNSPVQMHARPGSWSCECGRIHDPEIDICDCGAARPEQADVDVCEVDDESKAAAPTPPAQPAANEWVCICGSVNQSYVSTCSCGRSKYGR